jgi:hypothetical protein
MSGMNARTAKAEIISHLDITYLVIPKDGAAFMLLLDQLDQLNKLNALVNFIIVSNEDIQHRIGPDRFCIEFKGIAGNQVNPFLYELFAAFINNNLEEFSEG